MSLSFLIRQFDMHEFESLVEISAKEFPADDKLLRADYAQWLYLENPHGIAKIVSAAEPEHVKQQILKMCWFVPQYFSHLR